MDEVFRSRLHYQPHTGEMTHQLNDTTEDIVLERNAELRKKIEKITTDRKEILTKTELAIGGWLSAALDDPAVCAEMKLDITLWFTARN